MRNKLMTVIAVLASMWALAIQPNIAAAASAPLDARLIGVWANEHSYVSGDFSAASETLAELRGDGTYSFGASQFVGCGSSGSFDSGVGGESARGYWGPPQSCGLAMLHKLAGVSPARVIASHEPGIEPCRHIGDDMLDA